MENDLRQFAPACERNRDPILAVLKQHLPKNATAILEVAAGTGQHAVHFAPHFPTAHWYPTDVNPTALESIEAWVEHSGIQTIHRPRVLDVRQDPWPLKALDGILVVNMIHISEWSCTEGLMAGAGRHLVDGGVLYLYGPYKREGRHTAESNEQFEGWLQAQNPAWGVRELEKVTEEAEKNGLALKEVIPMPANNFSVVYVKK